MVANNYVLALYAISAIMAFTCAVLPGSGLFGRSLCVLAGMMLVIWPASTFLVRPWRELSVAVIAVPPILVGYGLLTARQYLAGNTWIPGLGTEVDSLPIEVEGDRRAPGRRSLPGEFGDVPINQAPASHDPWEALYASAERERLRADTGRHRTTSYRPAESNLPDPDPASVVATRLAFDTAPAFPPAPAFGSGSPWFLENIDEVSRRDAPRL